jgi:putative transcriptional regulator
MKNHLREFRTAANMSQSELAEKLAVSRQTIFNLEKGTFNPSVVLALKMAHIFNTSVENLFDLGDEFNN